MAVTQKDILTLGGGGSGGPITASQITDSTTTGQALVKAADAATARTAIALGNVDNTPDTGKPVSTAQAAAIAAAQSAATSAAASSAASASKSADTLVDGTSNKVMTAAERTKLAAIAAGATAYTDAMADARAAAAIAATGARRQMVFNTTSNSWPARSGYTGLADWDASTTLNAPDPTEMLKGDRVYDQH